MHQALCERRTACIRRLAGWRKREVQFSRFLRNESVTPREMVREAVTKTTARQVLEDVFEPGDQPILEALSLRLEGATERQKNPHPKGTLAFGTWVLARLGGWTSYYGKPGPKVISRGLYDFQRIKYGADLSLRL